MEVSEVNNPVGVAILEDQGLMRESLTDVLETAGFKVLVSSADPTAFLSSIGERMPAVAIIDLSLKGDQGQSSPDGLAVLREINRWHPTVRALVLSASGSPEMVKRCYAEGATGYLYKLTANVSAVIAAVHAAARGDRLMPMDFMDAQNSNGNEAAASSAPAEGRGLLDGVTIREREVLSYVAGGADNLKIASHLKITERTVKAHVSSLYRKLGPENRAQLALLARQLGVRPPPHL